MNTVVSLLFKTLMSAEPELTNVRTTQNVVNTEGSYKCECWDGFTKVGDKCEGTVKRHYNKILKW